MIDVHGHATILSVPYTMALVIESISEHHESNNFSADERRTRHVQA